MIMCMSMCVYIYICIERERDSLCINPTNRAGASWAVIFIPMPLPSKHKSVVLYPFVLRAVFYKLSRAWAWV